MRAGWVIVAMASLMAGASAGASMHREHFRWRMPVLIESASSGALYRAILPPAVFDGCKSFPADLRLIDEAGSDWPFFIQTDHAAEQPTALPFTRLEPSPTDPVRDGIQTILLDLQLKSVPLRRLVLQAADAEFTRTVKVYGRNSPTNAWRWMAEGELRRSADRERDWIDLHNVAFRHLKMEILHFDQPPLAITNLAVLIEPQQIVFKAARDGAVWLYFGSSAYGLPMFDLRHRVTPKALAAAISAEFGRREVNPYHFRAELWSYTRLLAIAFAVVLAILALGIFLRHLR